MRVGTRKRKGEIMRRVYRTEISEEEHKEEYRNEVAEMIMREGMRNSKPINVKKIFDLADEFVREYWDRSPMSVMALSAPRTKKS